MDFSVRPYCSGDLRAIYRICLLTGDAGADASHLYRDPDLLGHYYAASYVMLEPELCFVLVKGCEVCGYVLGTRDWDTFRVRAENEWFPALRARLPKPQAGDVSPDAQVLRRIHSGYEGASDSRDYPASLHIDLLTNAQGRGYGRKLIERFLTVLRDNGDIGVSLGVSLRNAAAMAFYEHLGFEALANQPGCRRYGMRLGEMT